MSETANPFEGRLRARACGLVVQQGRLLLVKINSPTRAEPFWMPPGGGISFREEAEAAVERELLEETGLTVRAAEPVFISEYISGRWHALEFYFRCTLLSGKIKLGHDPEMSPSKQMLQDIGWFSPDEISQMPVFPVFVKEAARSLTANGVLPLRFIKQQPHTSSS
ncbi:MAG: NUDIX hydrolase [Candidatus Cyclonatronum sp.]|uniref:NUDIX domain-containing protein n=1 Tax=Cyclonatronum sp. TaxID=3024185 RepID=UPI0025C482D9|nr:NUDIX hydrolase [Cyclonatronum sp.]MCC5932835.1 NUDIX hydrolase [Balneolales bacterium]MCH8485625.1 NUDIX hydrolase [Cyclonatronum sp.]